MRWCGGCRAGSLEAPVLAAQLEIDMTPFPLLVVSVMLLGVPASLSGQQAATVVAPEIMEWPSETTSPQVQASEGAARPSFGRVLYVTER